MTVPVRSNIHRPLLLLSLFAGFFLRLFNLGSESFWYDEAVSVYLAGKSVPDLIAHTVGDIHPPGYYLLLLGWRTLVQPSQAHGLEFLFTWPGMFAGLLIVALLYPIGRRLFGPRSALVAVWLVALSPFQIWYSQEVRMYTVAGALGLLAFWSMLQFLTGRRSWLLVYVAAATAGLYTLYYFAFLLIALNLAALGWIWTTQGASMGVRLRRSGAWIGAQIGVALLWLPWAPIFWRQITEPPVPPWRAPWQTPGAAIQSFSEGLGALLVGQSPPASLFWPWAIIAVVVTALFLVLPAEGRGPGNRTRMNKIAVLLSVFGPIALIYILTLLVTPIYHVRYFAPYAAPFSLVAGSVAASLYVQKRALLGGGLLSLLVLVSILSLAEFWSNPRYRADDHRQAVATLAAEWRPGDVILANAGWIYPLIAVYWPTELAGAEAVLPPGVDEYQRIIDYTKATSPEPLVIRTGSVDGPPSLGWGNPNSDFFATTASQSINALTNLAANHPRIWHYRLYDTVSDPQGILRQTLNQIGALRWEQPIPGRDLGLLQLYETGASAPNQPPALPLDVAFGDALRLEQMAAPTSVKSGSPLYVDLLWRALPGITALPTTLSMSLRLYDRTGSLALQADSQPLRPTDAWQPGQQVRQPLALPVPIDTKPGSYSLELVTYGQKRGEPLPPDDPATTVHGQRLILGDVEVELADQAPSDVQAVASFDYIDLVDSQLPSTAPPDTPLQVTLTWRPRASDYRDTYVAELALVDRSGAVAASWQRSLGGDAYPSGDWPPLFPVRDSFEVVLPETIAPGEYAWRLRVQRASDGAPIPARQKWQTHDGIQLGAIVLRK